MKLVRSLVSCFLLGIASSAFAALEYIQYNLDDRTSISITTPPTTPSEALALNTDNKILFVRDSSKPNANYYIAVFELTHAQAEKLKWTGAIEGSPVAFGAFTNENDQPLLRPLSYPTAAQWNAYVEEKPARKCNLNYGITDFSDPLTPNNWYENYLETGAVMPNNYGLYDTFGNVAECVVESDGAVTFHGGYAALECDFDVITRDNATWIKRLNDIQNNSYGAVAGVRPLYLPPEEQTYFVTVKLDGNIVDELTQSNIAPGSEVTIVPPTPPTGYKIQSYTVEPEGLSTPTFTMPQTDVIFNYYTRAQATLNVIGGNADKVQVCAGEEFTLTADPSRPFLYWEVAADLGITEENKTQNPLTLSLDSVTAGAELVYTAVFKPQAVVSVVNATPAQVTVAEGDIITVTAPANGSFSHWDGYGINNSNRYENPLILTIGEVDDGDVLTLTAVLKPAVSITVINGNSSSASVYEDGNFTLTATGKPWQQFDYWVGNYGITEYNKTQNPLTLRVNGLAAGSELQYEAKFISQPRVLVYGGTVSTSSANILGDGYYVAGSKLVLAPYSATPDGYVFSHWLKQDGTTVSIQNYSYTVGEAESIETFTAVYKADDSVTNKNIVHIGAISESNLTAKTAIGYTALATASHTYSKNSFNYYGTQVAASDYAQFVFATKAMDLVSVTKETANSEENRSKALVLKRVTPVSGQPYYVGIHEVTEAQYDTVVNQKTTTTSLLPHATYASTRSEADTFLNKLNALFGVTFAKPTQSQIENISTGALNNTGTYGDPKITSSMVNSEDDQKGLLPSGSQEVDPYGFYDLWGNAAETFANDATLLFGGCHWNAFTLCNLSTKEEATLNRPGAIRAAITVPVRYNVTVSNLNKTFPVLTGQKITLKEQVKPGCKFLGWTVETGTTTKTYTSMPQTITITAATSLTATFSDPLAEIALDYNGEILGPATAFPGTTIKVYPKTPGVMLKSLSVSPASAATVDPDLGTITFNESATDAVTITATYALPASGFRFQLR